jgi:hypothetical protein
VFEKHKEFNKILAERIDAISLNETEMQEFPLRAILSAKAIR